MEFRVFGRPLRRRHEKPHLTPAEIDALITSQASEASLLRYQECIGKSMAADLSGVVKQQADGYARHEGATSVPNAGVVPALHSVAEMIETSTFPTRVIHID